MDGTKSQLETKMSNLDCPWCGATASLVSAPESVSLLRVDDGATELHCPDCAISVALAPDPRVRVALAA
jgi:predicted RNA-binding Zn-ribbon protein involved in translation (DUF1610 family)